MRTLKFRLFDMETGRAGDTVDVVIDDVASIDEVKYPNPTGRGEIIATLLTKKDESSIIISDSPFHVSYQVRNGQYKWKK